MNTSMELEDSEIQKWLKNFLFIFNGLWFGTDIGADNWLNIISSKMSM